ncbi:hypothetical protein KC319_g9 [Hortaea werneckii]|nr:hypothetical protein KC319_g9 [Hortaea werneckii]
MIRDLVDLSLPRHEDVYTFQLWVTIENNIVIMAATMPYFKALIQSKRRGPMPSSSRPQGVSRTTYLRGRSGSEEHILEELPPEGTMKRTTNIRVNYHAPDDNADPRGQAQAEKLTASNKTRCSRMTTDSFSPEDAAEGGPIESVIRHCSLLAGVTRDRGVTKIIIVPYQFCCALLTDCYKLPQAVAGCYTVL